MSPRGRRACDGADEAVAEVEAFVEVADADALVFAVHAVVFEVDGDEGEAVGGDAAAAHEGAVGGSGFQCGDDSEAGPLGGDGGFDALNEAGRERRGGAGVHGPLDGPFDLVAGGLAECGFDFGLGVAGQDAAVHSGLGLLWESIGGVAGVEHGCDAGGAEEGVAVGVGGVLRFAGGAEPGAGNVVEHDGELVGAEFEEGLGEVVDGVVGAGLGAMAAGVAGGHGEGEEGLFGSLHGVGGEAAIACLGASGVDVDAELGVDEVAAVLEEPVDAVGFGAAFFAGGEGEDEVAVRGEAFAFEADEVGDEEGGVALDVLGAPAVEVAVAFEEAEGIDGPVVAAGFDDVEVGEEDDGAGCAAATEAGDEVALFGGGDDDLHVGFGESGGAEAVGNELGGGGAVAGGGRGVGLDQFAEDVAGELVVGGLRGEEGGEEGEEGEDAGCGVHRRRRAAWGRQRASVARGERGPGGARAERVDFVSRGRAWTSRS